MLRADVSVEIVRSGEQKNTKALDKRRFFENEKKKRDVPHACKMQDCATVPVLKKIRTEIWSQLK